jgi:FkbM family methyltransferase
MYRNKTIIQVGAHVGNTSNDHIFRDVDETTKLILVEPVPYLFEKLKKNYEGRFGKSENVIFINKAVSNKVGEIEMTIPSEDNDFSRLDRNASQWGSVNPEHALRHCRYLKVEKIKVESTTLNEIVKENKIEEIELLNTDTEGHDYVILMDYNFEIKPKKVIFEHTHMDGVFKTGEKFVELSKRLESLGYRKTKQEGYDTTFELI